METITVDTKKSDVAWNQYGNHSQVNTWCTFSKDSKDVYTLKQVGIDSTLKTAKKVAQSAMDAAAPATGVGEFDINTKNVSLHGSKVAHNTPGDMGDYTRVYGNDDTVYINAEMEEITVKDGDKKMVIVTDVDSVTTGVKNVDMTVKNHTKTGTKNAASYEECAKNEAYILYNKDGYIIGVVTLAAEDKGTSAKYAYITGDVNKEEYLGNDEWKWTQNAIIDGKVVELTEVDDTRAYLNSTEKGKWYEVRFDAKGNVSDLKENDKLDIAAVSSDPNRADEKAAKKITGSEIYFGFNKDRFINDMDEVWSAVNGKNDYESSKTVLLWVDYCTNNTGTHVNAASARADLSFKNGTLYTDTAQTEGFSVSPNVNVVLALAAKNHGSAFDDVDDRYTGYTGVEDALKNLDKSADAFDGFLCAVIEDGAATSIIFDERAGANRNDLEPVKPMSMIVTQVDEDGTVLGTKSFDWYGGAFQAGDVTAPSGYTFKNAKDASAFVEGKNGTVTFVYTKDKDDETDVPTKTGYVRVQFKDSANADVGSAFTLPVKVDTLGFGELTVDDVKGKVPAGYKIAASNPGVPTDITPDTGTDAIDVVLDELPTTDITAIAVHEKNGFTWAKYGVAVDATTIASELTFDLTYPNGVRTVAANFGTNKITYADKAGATGTATWTKDGLATATINGKSCDVPVKIYADVVTTVTAGADLSDWDITVPANTTTKAGKVTLTFAQKTGSEANFTATEMAALVAKLANDGTSDLTVGAFSNASLTTPGKAETSAGAGDGVAAVFTVDVAVSAPGANSVTLKVNAPAAP